MSDKLEALKAAALAIGHECWVQDGSSVNTEDYRIANGEMCCDHIGCFESVNGESPHAKYVSAASPAVVLELLAALEEKDRQLARYSMSAGQADQRLCESRAVRIALGFGEDAIDVAPYYLVEAIQAIRSRSEAAERRLQQPIKLPDIRSEDYHESGWFQHMKYYRDVVRSIQVLELKVEGE
ncbi:hypothetical protein [Serratia fonticola]|uniref:hypothetical protein n=1 Tax=Serratia fonticola TaxID=47917 RepID=UPI003AAE77E9|nr:hypothetical protein [Serratia fonticola]